MLRIHYLREREREGWRFAASPTVNNATNVTRMSSIFTGTSFGLSRDAFVDPARQLHTRPKVVLVVPWPRTWDFSTDEMRQEWESQISSVDDFDYHSKTHFLNTSSTMISAAQLRWNFSAHSIPFYIFTPDPSQQMRFLCSNKLFELYMSISISALQVVLEL